MRYVVQRRNALGGLEWKGESNELNKALAIAREVNRNREMPYYRGYKAYLFDTVEQRAIVVTDKPGYWCVWYGGSSYSVGEPEFFSNINAIKSELERRYNNQRRYPCVDLESHFLCCVGEWSEDPNFIVMFGANGGVVKRNL